MQRLIAECLVGTCAVLVRGMPLGSSAPTFGSLVRFGQRLMLTTLDTNSITGYSTPFTSLDEPLLVDVVQSPGSRRHFLSFHFF